MAQGADHRRYRIELTSAALRDLKALPKNVLRRVDRRILALADNPRPRGAKKLKGEDEVLLITVIRIRHRRDVYREPS